MEKVKLKPLTTWADTEEELGFSLSENDEYLITNKGRLVALSPYASTEDLQESGDLEPNEEILHKFYLPSLISYHTTDYLRWACEELHPEVDFDREFRTDEPGVFARYQERFGYDYEEDVHRMKSDSLKERLKELGYELVFP